MASARKSGAPPQRSTSRPPGRGPGGARCRRQIGVAESNRGVSDPPLRPCDRDPPRPGGRSRPACLSYGRARRRRNERAHGRSPVRSARESAFRRGDDVLAPHSHSTARRSLSSLLLACLSGKQGHRVEAVFPAPRCPAPAGPAGLAFPDHHAVDGGLALVPVKAPRWRSAHASGVASAWTGASIEPRPAYA